MSRERNPREGNGKELGLGARLALAVVCRGLRRVGAGAAERGYDGPEIAVEAPDGSCLIAVGGTSKTRCSIRLLDDRGAYRLFGQDPSMGLAEAYIEGSVEFKPSIRHVLAAAIRLAKKDPKDSPQISLGVMGVVSKCKDAFLHALKPNSKDGSRANIAAHYDLSNDFFRLFLDKTMTYSSALYPVETNDRYLTNFNSNSEDEDDDATDDKLEAAQLAKLDALIDKAGVKNGDRVLEIGCGWLSLALRCCERFDRCEYVATTISQAQLEEAQDRLKKAPSGLQNRIKVAFCDYRDAARTLAKDNPFDRILSCEMIEAVGHAYLPGYFEAIDECLRPGGTAALQVIAVPDERYPSYIRGSDFIRKHVFPGSSLVCLKAIQEALPGYRPNDDTFQRLRLGETTSLGLSYARTLAAWRRRYDQHKPDVAALGFDAAFQRKWTYYLEYCEAGFATSHIDVYQIKLIKTDQDAVALSEKTPHGGQPKTTKDLAIKILRTFASKALERGYLPDVLLRLGCRVLARQQLRHCADAAKLLTNTNSRTGGVPGLVTEALKQTVANLKEAPVAVCTEFANDQHYEVDERFYGLVLGPRRKYSACLFLDDDKALVPHPGGTRSAAAALPAAEIASLEEVARRARIDETTRTILDLGCGWGSASLFLAERYPQAKVVGVSNSHSQRNYIMARAKERGLTNLDIATLDLSQSDLTPALEKLHQLLPDATFDRAVSIEMFEHMKNYDALFTKIAAVLTPQVGTLFVHVFCHKEYAYHFVARSESDWMARHFFAGGTMPSANLFFFFATGKGAPLAIVDHWRSSGSHYALTGEAWLQNMDLHKDAILAIFASTYPDPLTWWHRWRAFFISLTQVFGLENGNQWCIAHYLFQVR